MNEKTSKAIEWQELYQKYQSYIEKFAKEPEEAKRALIMESLIYDIQAMQRIIKTLDSNAEDPIEISELNPDEEQYLEKLYLLILKLQFTFANMNNKLFGVLEEDTKMIEELHQSPHK